MKLSTLIKESPIFIFSAKATIFFILATYMLETIIPSSKIENFVYTINNQVNSKIHDEKNQLYILGLIQNPVAFYKSSEYYEKNGNLDRAIRDMELAIGLLEVYQVKNSILNSYEKRLNNLKEIQKSKSVK